MSKQVNSKLHPTLDPQSFTCPCCPTPSRCSVRLPVGMTFYIHGKVDDTLAKTGTTFKWSIEVCPSSGGEGHSSGRWPCSHICELGIHAKLYMHIVYSIGRSQTPLYIYCFFAPVVSLILISHLYYF